MGDNDIESFKVNEISGGFLSIIFQPVAEVCSKTDTSQGVLANFGKDEVVMEFLSG
ncbi:MAG: hypothetical protein ABIJ25_00010 [Pseudomonadota bacterium]